MAEVQGLTAADGIYAIPNTPIKPVVISVEKIWKDTNTEARPAEIEVVLYKDGAAYETVKLNASNGWKYTWKQGMTDEFTWTVDEVNVPNGYKKTVEAAENLYKITNTYIGEELIDTGDDTNLMLWGGLMLMASAGFVLLMVRRREEEEA